MGSATSATQIESGDKNNSWYRWSKERHTKDGTVSDDTCDHYNRVDEDIALQKQLNMQTHRFSIEWSRIAPQKGILNRHALNHYIDEAEKLVNAGIKPFVTLHHFSNPLWIEDSGGWLNPETIKYFIEYTEFVTRHMGNLVSDWCTFNEPNTYLFAGYIHGVWPPGEQYQLGKYFTGANNIIRAHVEAYSKIHEVRKSLGHLDTKAGFAIHLRVFKPKMLTPFDRLITRNFDYWFQGFLNIGLIKGMTRTFSGFRKLLGKYNRYCDYYGINYYTRDVVSFILNPSTFFGRPEAVHHNSASDMGWEIYPKGLYKIARKMYKKYKLPIFITENGIADSRDSNRLFYIYSHLKKIEKLIAKGVDVQRYYHWSLLDNFEWMEGMEPKFGLIAVDPATKERTIRKSGLFYSEIIKNSGVNDEMIKKYLQKQQK